MRTVAAVLLLALAGTALAQGKAGAGARHGGGRPHGGTHHHGGHHPHGGHHHHGHHHSTFVGVGFWGPWWYPPYYPYYSYYSYPYTVVAPYQPTTYIEQAAPAPEPTNWWYYCEPSRGYYPYVRECPGGWQRVPPTPAR